MCNFNIFAFFQEKQVKQVESIPTTTSKFSSIYDALILGYLEILNRFRNRFRIDLDIEIFRNIVHSENILCSSIIRSLFIIIISLIITILK